MEDALAPPRAMARSDRHTEASAEAAQAKMDKPATVCITPLAIGAERQMATYQVSFMVPPCAPGRRRAPALQFRRSGGTQPPLLQLDAPTFFRRQIGRVHHACDREPQLAVGERGPSGRYGRHEVLAHGQVA